jgi:hypothetical protein
MYSGAEGDASGYAITLTVSAKNADRCKGKTFSF